MILKYKLKTFLSLSVLLMLVFFLNNCSTFSDFKVHNKFVQQILLNDLQIKHHYFDNPRLHFAEKGNPEKGIIIWLHGTPGLWTEAGRLFTNDKLLEEVILVSIDRSGWGESVDEESESGIVSFEKQSQSISRVITYYKNKYPDVPVFLAGHSWGASLAPYIALDNLDSVKGLLLAAGAVDPELASPRFYHYLADRWPVSKIIGKQMRLANDEMFLLQQGLTEVMPEWKDLKSIPTIGLQGKKDSLVSYKNIDFLRNSLGDDSFYLVLDNEYGHLWHIQRSQLISQCLLALVYADFQRCTLEKDI